MTSESGETGSRSAGRTIALVAFLACFGLTVALIALSFPAGFYAIFSGKLSSTYTVNSIVRPWLFIGPAATFLPFVVNAGVWFLALSVIYAAFIIYSAYQHKRPTDAISGSFKTGLGEILSSPLVVVVTSIMFVLFTTSVIDNVIITFLPIGTISGDPFQVFVGLTYPPLVEEFGFRVLLIGTVAVILSIGRPWKDALTALWRPSKAIEGFAVGSGASIIIWAATTFSAVTFGACHIYCGSGWYIGKLPEATYGGFVFGYLYVRYGFHVAVLAHWGVDYFGSAFSFFGQAAYGIPWDSTKEFIGQIVVDYDVLLLMGLASFILVCYLGIRKFILSRRQPSPAQFNVVMEGGPPP